ncbi:hypothetical protein MUK42_18561 [Musa troglodytarum]|uniref:Uncharacterized protein n=1 Tax=Musa troglodytarum TaxID=320322 RepID=A0A9E7JKK5_9LILI|nr:hypothetical protein MUK42_18561 [Musa troglodytarum]URD84526.1 hypothetical protein MUK42_18561 [Musa troglodytarum]URD84527.1 hypothetical protein MUK42_18561 [Musa troglodytarum]
MNRRIRSPNAKLSASQIEERHHRFLKPGALARLRDSRISTARSPRSFSQPRLFSPSFPFPAPPPVSAHDYGIPFFAARARGTRFPQRKKLAAAKSIFFAPSSLELNEFLLDAFGTDMVAAH